MNVTSPAFGYWEAIPLKYSVEGENISPPLAFSDIPSEAASLVLIVEDPDVPKTIRPDGLWIHWTVWNLPSDTRLVQEGIVPWGIVWPNGRGVHAYGGPNPPNGRHRYFFRLFALDTVLDIPKESDRNALLFAMSDHVIEEGVLMGTYVRSDFVP